MGSLNKQTKNIKRGSREATGILKKKKTDLRIIAGAFRGQKIQCEVTQHCRPTSSRLRETLFNWLQFEIPDMYCLDLFAGSGILGFEALSRGAKHCSFFDQSSSCRRRIAEHIEKLRLNDRAQVRKAVFPSRMPDDTVVSSYDCVFIDPPFDDCCIADGKGAISTSSLLIDAIFICRYIYTE